MNNSTNLHVVVGGQYGSEAKGHVAAYLHQQNPGMLGVRVGGPNAGHTAYDEDGEKWALRQVPVAAVVDESSPLIIAAGSEIDATVLIDEVRRLEDAGHSISERLFIDRQATMLDPRHRDQEIRLTHMIGSTGKGIGAARADRLMRGARIAADMGDCPFGSVVDTQAMLNNALVAGQKVLIEGTQGYGLGLHAGFYPKVTAGNCRAIDFLAQAGVSPWALAVENFRVWVTLRSYPIRVAGPSGWMLNETTWDALGLPEERTTVTKKVRRVGAWDPDLARRAVLANGGGGAMGPVRIAWTMADQLFPHLQGATGTLDRRVNHSKFLTEVIDHALSIEREVDAPVQLIATGPNTMMEVR